MAAHVIFIPSILNLGTFGPGNTKPFVSVVATAPVTARMSAAIVNDTSNGGFHIVDLMSSILVDVDPNDPEFPIPKGTHARGKTLQVIDASDGSRAINVPQESDASVRETFRAPNPPFADSYSATFTIFPHTWDRIDIPIS